jgi:hypothetical protein
MILEDIVTILNENNCFTQRIPRSKQKVFLKSHKSAIFLDDIVEIYNEQHEE